jgi:hypothetical protein
LKEPRRLMMKLKLLTRLPRRTKKKFLTCVTKMIRQSRRLMSQRSLIGSTRKKLIRLSRISKTSLMSTMVVAAMAAMETAMKNTK